MPAQTANPEENVTVTKVFDEQGNEVNEAVEAAAPGATEDAEEVAEGGAKYTIGDKSFSTLEDAHAYATSQISTLETEKQIGDAYRLGVQDAAAHVQPAAPAAPAPEEKFDEDLYYSNPAEFLKQFASKITTQVHGVVDRNLSEKEQATRIWNEFTARHPDLADFRAEVETVAAQNLTELRAVNATKGIAAGYDFVALRLKAQFAKYAQTVKPRKQLPNGGAAATAASGGAGVTPKTPAKKALSMKEQIAMIKPKRR
jgi:hypothetical protein